MTLLPTYLFIIIHLTEPNCDRRSQNLFTP